MIHIRKTQHQLGSGVSSFWCWCWCACFGSHLGTGFAVLELISRRFSPCWNVVRRMQHFHNQVPKIKRGNFVHAETSVQRDNFRFGCAVRHCCLFLTHPTYGYKCSTSEDAQVSPEVDFESSRSPAKSESWNNPNRRCCAVVPTWQYCLQSLVL